MDSTFSAFITLLLVMDPLGNVPIFLAVLRDVEGRRRYWVIFRELLVALAALLLFLYGGSYLLDLLNLKQESISIAGAIILFLIAIRMIFPSPYGLMGDTPEGEPFIVPLAIPMVAGPSAMAVVMLLSSDNPDRMPEWVLALFLAWLLTSVILLSANGLKRFLGRRGLIAMERLMGMLLVAIAVQMLLEGISAYLAELG